MRGGSEHRQRRVNLFDAWEWYARELCGKPQPASAETLTPLPQFRRGHFPNLLPKVGIRGGHCKPGGSVSRQGPRS
jgi:hypothetical protein